MAKLFHSSEGEDALCAYKSLLENRIDKALNSFQKFIHIQIAASALLILCTAIALIWASIDTIQHSYHVIINTTFGFSINTLNFNRPLSFWINDLLLTLFFFFVGLEIKREFLVGDLTHRKTAFLVIIAAIGGMLVPAVIYLFFNAGHPAQHGWGIPMATDTAFALGIASCFKHRLPKGTFAFIAALAIIDDIGSVIIIALFYTQTIRVDMLYFSLGLLMLLIILNYAGIRRPLPYLIVGFFMWATTQAAGIHGTIAAIFAAFCVPARPQHGPKLFLDKTESLISYFKERKTQEPLIIKDEEQHTTLKHVQQLAKEATTPLQQWESKLQLPVSLIILPAFAFTNAGIDISYQLVHSLVNHRLALGIIAALVLGKPLGIMLFTWIAKVTQIGKLPNNTSFKHIIAICPLMGIGFTMSLLITNLSFITAPYILLAKGAILFSSILAALLGVLLITTLTQKCELN